MKKILTATQMGEVDGLTTEEFGVPSLTLMENAAKAVVEVITDEVGGSVRKRGVIVLCGSGNNGGDGAVVARILREEGARVDAYLLGRIEETRGDARHNFEKYVSGQPGAGGKFEVATSEEIDAIWDRARSSPGTVDVIVDAVFGTGLHRPVEGIHKYYLQSAADYARESSPQPLLISIDLPSGVDADRTEPIGYHFRPQITVTFTAPKLANAMPPVSREQGRLIIKDIGSPAALVERALSETYLADEEDVRKWLERTAFSVDSYKKTRGSVLVLAGSEKYTGAAVLAANGAMRSGVGIVTVATPVSAYQAVAARILPEVMIRSVSETDSGSFSMSAIADIAELRENADAVLIGCGVTSNDRETRDFARDIAINRNSPVIVDADGLNALSPFELQGSDENPLILTPHEGEFRRLRGGKDKSNGALRIDSVREFAVRHKVVCVLKGERSLIASPDGRVVINPTGNPGLGKAGNGDTLAGVIAGFVAQEAALSSAGRGNVFAAVAAALYFSGLAGDIAAERFGERVMTASDVRECLAAAFRRFEKAGQN